jgi:hypothetical protein
LFSGTHVKPYILPVSRLRWSLAQAYFFQTREQAMQKLSTPDNWNSMPGKITILYDLF